MPLDLRPTFSSSGAVGSAIVIIGRRLGHPVLDLTLPSLCPPIQPGAQPGEFSVPSPGRRVQTAPRSPGLPQEPGWAPQFQHTPPTLSIQPSITSPATDPVEPEHRYHTCLSRLSSPSLSHSKLSRCHVWFLSCQGAPSLIGEEKVNRCVLEFPPQLWP